MKLRLLFTFLTTMLLSGSLWAKFVNEEAARNVAKNFYYERILISDAVTYSSLQLDLATTAEKSGVAEYYVYNVRNRGYIVVSADDATIPILAYSFSSQYEPEKMPAAFRYWTNVFSLQIAEVRRVDAQPTQEITQQWKYFSNTSNIVNNPNRGLRAVDPLIESSWGQGNFYNDLCPVDAGSSPYTGNDHVPVGCVATSTSQVMHYWKFPKVGTGSNSYYASGYGTQSANFGATTYNWHNMPNRLTTVNNDVATLCYHIGVGVDMSYDTDGSGSDTYYVRNLLKNNFYYSTNISYKSKNSTYFDSNSYSDAQWIAILVPQLDAHQPMVYSGFESGGGGHAFVCDGYQGTDYFHFNFGWDGYGDGYFYITSINSAGGNFTSGQAIVCNIYPSTSMYPYFCNATGVTYTTPEGMFDDGSGPNADYQNNANCNFLIAPPNMNQIVLTVNSVNTEDAQDIVTIFDGETTSAPVLGTFSGTTPPTGTILSTQGKMLLVFSSNGTTTDAGWQVSYSSRSCGGS
ncbi:MAG: C10 family peptidase, partial [Bacteroidetes bacterium]|nr:C10 family peptidase [Bacteroidota bacterium]